MTLSADQKAVLSQSWLRVKAARAALLQHHDQIAAQVAMLHEQYVANMARYEQALHVQFARSRSPGQHQQDHPYTQCNVSTTARSTWPPPAANHQGLQQQQLSLTMQQQVSRLEPDTSVLPGPWNVLGGNPDSLNSAEEEQCGRLQPLPGVERYAELQAEGVAGGSGQGIGPAEQQLMAPPCVQQHQAALPTDRLPAVGSAASARLLSLDQELLLTMNNQQQQELEGQLAAVKRQLSVLYAEQTMTLCNTLSKKQLAVAFVQSYPLLLDIFASEYRAMACNLHSTCFCVQKTMFDAASKTCCQQILAM